MKPLVLAVELQRQFCTISKESAGGNIVLTGTPSSEGEFQS
jgi:hypothetical protein